MRPAGALRELWVGVLLTVAFVVFFVLLISVGEQQNLLAPKNVYHTAFRQTQGLAIGAPVRLEGVPVGSVTDISFPEDPNDSRVLVTFQVERSVAPRIKEDTQALIVTQGIIGEVLLGLKRGSRAAPVAEPDSYLPAVETGTLEEFKSQGQIIAENILQISSNISAIMERIERGEGLLARLLTDDEYARAFLARIDATSESLEGIVQTLNQGESFLGRLLTAGDPEATAAADHVFASIDKVTRILERVEAGEGALGRLVQDDQVLDDFITNLEEMSQSVKSLTRQIEEGEGLLARLIRDEEWAEETVRDLRQVSRDLASITARLEGGEGTLGLLLTDPAVYDGLKNLVGGIEKSRVLRWFIRRKVAKGAKAELEEQTETGETGKSEEAP